MRTKAKQHGAIKIKHRVFWECQDFRKEETEAMRKRIIVTTATVPLELLL